jgi:hypothetical protein
MRLLRKNWIKPISSNLQVSSMLYVQSMQRSRSMLFSLLFERGEL